MVIYNPPDLFRKLYQGDLIWEFPEIDNKIYLTFDDGPVPDVTPYILKILKEYAVKATFFCVGENVWKYPDVYEMVIAEGHSSGNHTYNHLNGWKTATKTYCENVEKCAELIRSDLFRPPYGRIRPSQIKILKKKYRIVFWSVLAGDFNKNFSSARCVRNVLKYTRSGAVIVFHDTGKTKQKVLEALPETIEGLLEQGYSFGKIVQL